MKRSLFAAGAALLALLFLAACACAEYYPVGDLDGGRDVDMDDLNLFAQTWLSPGCVEPGCEADLVLWGCSSVEHLAWHMAVNHALAVVKRGRVEGPPDLAVEIVSPDSVDRDYGKKRGQCSGNGCSCAKARS